jgi:hypothetical protein
VSNESPYKVLAEALFLSVLAVCATALLIAWMVTG